MKKLFTRIVCLICVCACALCAFACDGGNKKPRSETLTITVSNLGFGTNWLYAIADEFERLYDVDVQISPTVIAKDLLTQLDNDYQLDDLCFFAGVSSVWSTMRRGKFTQIDDVWEMTIDGETKSVKEKAVPEYVEAYKFNDHYYSVPFITEIMGLAYNKTTLDTLFGKNNWSLPRTTNEMNAFCDSIRQKEAYAFTWCNKENACYWGGVIEIWQAQYDGAEQYNHMALAEKYDPETDSYVFDTTGELLDMKGKLRALEVAEKYIYKDNGYSHRYATSMQFAESQAAFAGIPYANDKKLVAFTPNGSWLYEENQEDFDYMLQDIGFMTAPVISSLSEKLSYYNSDGEFNKLSATEQAAYDEVLLAIVDYVDGKTATAPTTVGGYNVSAADIERVREARNIINTKDQAHAFIPFNSQNPTLAKKFIEFFCSDYAGNIFSTVTHGFSPFNSQVTSDNESFLNDFDKDVANLLNNSAKKILYYSRTGFWISTSTPEDMFQKTGMYGTAEKAYYDYYVAKNKEIWQDKLRVAGMLAL